MEAYAAPTMPSGPRQGLKPSPVPVQPHSLEPITPTASQSPTPVARVSPPPGSPYPGPQPQLQLPQTVVYQPLGYPAASQGAAQLLQPRSVSQPALLPSAQAQQAAYPLPVKAATCGPSHFPPCSPSPPAPISPGGAFRPVSGPPAGYPPCTAQGGAMAVQQPLAGGYPGGGSMVAMPPPGALPFGPVLQRQLAFTPAHPLQQQLEQQQLQQQQMLLAMQQQQQMLHQQSMIIMQQRAAAGAHQEGAGACRSKSGKKKSGKEMQKVAGALGAFLGACLGGFCGE